MFFSGKISNSVITYLGKKGADLEGLYDLTEVPSEFLRDPTCWVEADKVELFLQAVDREYSFMFPDEDILEAVGHGCMDLRAWGVLDSVLRMMVKPQDVFTQPQRFISYFISPEPPLGNLERGKDFFGFEIPISSDEYPFVTTYLKSALEALPKFMGQEMAHSEWKGTRLVLNWSNRQESFFGENEKGHNVDPAFIQSLVTSLELTEKELEAKKKEVAEKDLLLKQFQSQDVIQQVSGLAAEDIDAEVFQKALELLEPVLRDVQGQFMRVIDYQTRAQQLVTLLMSGGRQNRQSREALKRVDWDYVRQEFPRVVDQGVENIRFIKQSMGQLARGDFHQWVLDARKQQGCAEAGPAPDFSSDQLDQLSFQET